MPVKRPTKQADKIADLPNCSNGDSSSSSGIGRGKIGSCFGCLSRGNLEVTMSSSPSSFSFTLQRHILR